MDTQLHYYRPDWIERSDNVISADACVYGGSAAGVIAAAVLAEQGVSVVLAHPGHTLGGMTTGGLGLTDYGQVNAIGGKAREVYRRIGEIYGQSEQLHFEPSVAQRAIDDIAAASGMQICRYAYLDCVGLEGNSISSAHFLGGLEIRAKIWIDATYEGDLLAESGVPFTIGREGNAKYGEQANGVQVRHSHQFSPARVDPHVIEGDPASGLLPFIEAQNLFEHIGKGDHKVQAYCFRVCMTDDPKLKADWEKPHGYNPLDHELAVRWFAQSEKDAHAEHLPSHEQKPLKFDVLANLTPGGFRKTDTNNHGAVSSDFIGACYAWPTADHAVREKIFQAHIKYQQGFYWTMANDERIPRRYREAYRQWGLPRDEFIDTAHWPHQLYVREARRMIGDIVLTEQVCRNKVSISDPVGMGSYTLDSHNCTRFIGPDGFVRNEGDVQLSVNAPYPISYRCVIPPAGSCENLLVPICFSASHIAYGSARMEPVFMLLAESCARAAKLALDDRSSVQCIDYKKLRNILENIGQVLQYS